jgi:hypothetical protein
MSFDFLSSFCLDTFLILRIQRDIVIHLHIASRKAPNIPVRFKRDVNFFDGISKNTNTKFNENPSSVSRVVPSGRTDGQTNRGT